MRVLPRGQRALKGDADRARLIPSLPERVDLIRRLFHLYTREGLGFKAICERFNRERLPAARGGSWSIGSVRDYLRNRAYTGDSVWNRKTSAKFHRVSKDRATERPRHEFDTHRSNPEEDWIIVPKTHEALVSRKTYEQALRQMRERGRNASPGSFRRGRGLTSPYLLSGLLRCQRCGHAYQGRTVSPGKRKDGSRIPKQFYYACGGHVMKGNHVCAPYLLKKDELEAMVLKGVQKRLSGLLGSPKGQAKLRKLLKAEMGAQSPNPRKEAQEVRKQLQAIQEKADILLESLSPTNQIWVDEKLAALERERRSLEARLEELMVLPYQPLNLDSLMDAAWAALSDLSRVAENGSLEERKEFVRGFLAGMKIDPDSDKGTLLWWKLPRAALSGDPDSSVGMVPGGRSELLQMQEVSPRVVTLRPYRVGRKAA